MKRKHLPSSQKRFASRPGQLNVVRLNGKHSYWNDLYHLLLKLSWAGFVTLISLFYLGSNALFAIAYLAGGDCIANARSGSFLDAFFFSVQTMATIGYGAMYPSTLYANSIVAIEALAGMLWVAMVAGLAFARFSLPTARVLFSGVAVITTYDGVPTLMFRTANQRQNQILEAQVGITLVRNEVNQEGQFMRRFYELNLVRSRSPIFALSWTVMHQINEKSPLYEASPELLSEQEIELIVTLMGIDETVSQNIHARYSYSAQTILWNMRFVDILSVLPDGQRSIDYKHFHDVIPS